jgi:hypothetical protein
MITAAIEELVICKDTLEHLNKSPMPAKTAFRFSGIVRHFNERLAELEQAIEDKRVELGEEQLGQRVEIPGERIEVGELGPMVALTPSQATLLYWLIYEEQK